MYTLVISIMLNVDDSVYFRKLLPITRYLAEVKLPFRCGKLTLHTSTVTEGHKLDLSDR
jgi:hypothetical protein